MMNGGWTWATVPIELLWRYAAFDTCITAQLDEEQYPAIQASWSGIYGLELASTQVLLDMETRGMLTDRRYLGWAYEEWGLDLAGIKHELKEQWRIGNPNSREQVARRLSEDGVQFIAFTDTGKPQLTEDVLDGIDHPVAKLALRYYELSSLRNTFVKNLLELADESGYLHPDINPLGARTGRMSVSRPSMQNMPAKDPRIRDGFIAPPGESLIAADYDQVEMRIFAHYSQDKAMLEAIRYGDALAEAGYEGYDLHSMNARMVYSIAMEDAVPKPLRKRVKGVGFAKVYGTGLATFAATAGLSLDEAQSVLDAYDAAFPGVRAFQHTVTGTLWQRQRDNGDPFLVTAYGRKEPCDPHVAYKGVNYLIQGSAADVLKDRLVALSKTWVGQHMLMPIHDEILFSVPDDALHEALAVIKEVMPVRDRFQVPLTVEAKHVKRWGDKYREDGETYETSGHASLRVSV
jgi:DNA polymerase-1